MKSNKHKTNAIKIGLAAVFTLLIGGFIYVTRYRITDIDAAVSPDGAHEIIFQAVGEPDRPFGYSHARRVLQYVMCVHYSENGRKRTVNKVTDFLSAALPWISMGLLLAIFFAQNGRKKREKKENYATEGMALGMCFGTAIGTSLGGNTGLGLTLGMLAGFVIGSCMEKKKNDDGE